MHEALVRIVELPAFRVVGLEITCQMDAVSNIPVLWQRFCLMEDRLPLHEGIYGVCLPIEGDPQSFRYIACARVPESVAVPEGMVAMQVPAAKYAVYPYRGKISDMSEAFVEICTKLIPAAGLDPDISNILCLEYFPPFCIDEITSVMTVDLYMAVK